MQQTEVSYSAAPRPPSLNPIQHRWILFASFGGLLLLMLFVALDSVDSLRRIQRGNDEIQREYLSRSQVLEKIRADLYLSGTYVRDYLLDPDPARAEEHKQNLIQTRLEMNQELETYNHLVSSIDAKAFSDLNQQLADFWAVLNPVLQWDAPRRQKNGFEFASGQVFPRRTAMLGIADQIAELNADQLTAGRSRIQYIFSHSRDQLIITMGITIALGAALAIFSIREILHFAGENERYYREIANARVELKQLSARLVEVQENERRSISRELHDEVGQALTAVLVEMGNLSRAMQKGEPEGLLNEHLESIKGLVENSVRVVRNMALLLRPSMLDDFGLVPALQWQAREFSKRTGIRARVSADSVADNLPEEYKTCIYRIVQEALHNSSRHAQAQQVLIGARQEGDRILLSIQDDGKGFDLSQGRGLGLLGIQERVSHLGGTFQVETEPGSGTLLRVVLPVAPVRERIAEPVEEEETRATS